ncbi:50S ribosomal protein L13 [Candidatus Saganbacteria bacterium]|nr:50S ribosomal protein L13 [Candidatus Saganbacteria bacterium]
MKRKTFSLKEEKVKREQYIVDANGKILGRLAARVAEVLRGKHKRDFTPHIDSGDNVVVVNAKDIAATGGKGKSKIYFTHSGYPGGHKLLTMEEVKRRDPRRIILFAVKGMLPKGPLGRRMIKKLTVHAGSAEVSGKPLKV